MLVAFVGLGATEILLVGVVAFLLFGVDKLPEAARALGRARAEFERARSRVMNELALADSALTKEQVAFERGRERQMDSQAFEARRVARAAEALGIDTAGKSEETLRREIQTSLGKTPDPEEPVSPQGASRWPPRAEDEAPWPENDAEPAPSKDDP